jgi:hypothetical protein
MRIYFFEHGFYQVADRDHARGAKVRLKDVCEGFWAARWM